MHFLVMHQLQGMIDGSIPQPVSHIVVSYGMQQPNPVHGLWIPVDQKVRAWILATVSKDTLTEIIDLTHSYHIRLWQRLES